jgi:hypothetical protein
MRASLIAGPLAAGIMALGASASPDENHGEIAGQVVNQATGTPLKDAVVTLRYVKPFGPAETMVQQTNEAGRFSFTGLWGRAWELSAACSGFAPGTYRATRHDPRGSFSLAKDQQIKDIVLKLIPQAVVTGRVLNAEGKPVEGARVRLLKIGFAGAVPHSIEVASSETLDNGEYRIPRVAPGRYLVAGSIPRSEFNRMPGESGGETGFAVTYHPNVTDSSLSAPIEVSGAQEVHGVDIQLVPVRLFHVRGKLQSPTAWNNVSGLLMLIDRADPAKVIATFTSAPPDFRFDIAQVPPGSYLVYGKLGMTPLYQAQQAVEVAGSDVDGLLLRVARPDAISAVLRQRPDSPQVDLHKIAIRAPFISAGTGPGYNWEPAQIRDDLSFRVMTDFGAGFVRFRVNVSDLPEGCYVASVRYGDTEMPESGIEYSPGAALVITIGVDGGRVDGMTLKDDNQPAGAAVVGLFPADGKGAPRSLQSDAQGAFHFTGIPPGDYHLIAWDDVSKDDLENPEFVKRFAGKATAISIATGVSSSASLKVVAQ